MSVLQSWPVLREFDPKNMPFRRLGPSGLRVPVFSLGGCEFLALSRETMTDYNIPLSLSIRAHSWRNRCWGSCEGL